MFVRDHFYVEHRAHLRRSTLKLACLKQSFNNSRMEYVETYSMLQN
jgi:hypothetical protein